MLTSGALFALFAALFTPSDAARSHERIVLGERNAKPVEPCSNREYQRCLHILHSFGNENLSPKNKTQLDAVCIKWRQVVNCVDTHQHSCFTAAQRQLFNQVISGAREFLNEICVDGPTQTEYLRHVQCNDRITKDGSRCGGIYRQTIRMGQTTSDQHINQKEDAKKVEQALTQFCCRFSDYVQCVSTYIAEECGSNATIFFERHLRRLSAGFVDEQCSHYIHGSSTCSLGSLAILQPTLQFLLIVLLLFLLQ